MHTIGTNHRVNPLLKGVNASPIPVPNVAWLEREDLIVKFNDFRTRSINILSYSKKLSTVEQAWSLNGNMHLTPGSCNQYGYSIHDWEGLYNASMSNANPHHIALPVSHEDLHNLNTMLCQYKRHCKLHVSNIQDLAESLIASYASSPFVIVSNACEMANSLSAHINYNRNTSSMSEDTYTMNFVGRIMDSFLLYSVSYEKAWR